MYKTLIVILCSLILAPAHAQRATDTFRLYFDLNVPAMNSATEKKIDLLVYNDKIINGSTVMIIGYADYLGTEGYNKNLSMQRAKNVKEYLVKYGIDADNIKLCLGKGEIERSGLKSKEGFPTDRRVDVVVNNKMNRKMPAEKPKIVYRPMKDTAKQARAGNIDELKNLKTGSTFLLKNVYFPPDRHIIKPESAETLEKLYMVLRDNPTLKISIEGHVCCIGKEAADAWDIDTYEPTLSVNRAKAIYNYLIDKGIEASRLKYAGFGRRRPVIEDERTEEDAEKNRRVEVRVIDNK